MGASNPHNGVFPLHADEVTVGGMNLYAQDPPSTRWVWVGSKLLCCNQVVNPPQLVCCERAGTVSLDPQSEVLGDIVERKYLQQ